MLTFRSKTWICRRRGHKYGYIRTTPVMGRAALCNLPYLAEVSKVGQEPATVTTLHHDTMAEVYILPIKAVLYQQTHYLYSQYLQQVQ